MVTVTVICCECTINGCRVPWKSDIACSSLVGTPTACKGSAVDRSEDHSTALHYWTELRPVPGTIIMYRMIRALKYIMVYFNVFLFEYIFIYLLNRCSTKALNNVTHYNCFRHWLRDATGDPSRTTGFLPYLGATIPQLRVWVKSCSISSSVASNSVPPSHARGCEEIL